MISFICYNEDGIVTVRDTQVIRRLDVVLTKIRSKKQEKGHAAVPMNSAGLHWVDSRETFAVPCDFVFRFNYSNKGVVIILVAAVTGD